MSECFLAPRYTCFIAFTSKKRGGNGGRKEKSLFSPLVHSRDSCGSHLHRSHFVHEKLGKETDFLESKHFAHYVI